MKTYRIGILGATGMVGQRLITLLSGHPWFKINVLAAGGSSAGLTYQDAVKERWKMASPIPDTICAMKVFDAQKDASAIAASVDFVFCAVDLPADEIRALEEHYAKLECPVVSNNSAHRMTPDVPMIIPEINACHNAIIPYQRRRLKTNRGFVAAKPNCSLQSFVPALHALRGFGINKVLACTYQAISGAGKNFDSWPEMNDNIIPFIGGEEEKSQTEPLKIWGELVIDRSGYSGIITHAAAPSVTAQCIRVPVLDGHMAAVFASFDKKPPFDKIVHLWSEYEGEAQRLKLPSAPKKFLHYFEEDSYPQTRLHRNLENGMAISIGRLRGDTQYDIKFVSLSHNTVRGAAGGALLLAELLCAQGWI